jgi:hypothetical protein
VVETTPLASVLSALWQQLASNPGNRALVIAGLLKNHALDEQTREMFVERISRLTPPSQARTDALRLLVLPLSPIQIPLPTQFVEQRQPIRVDPELDRITLSLSCAAEFRLWIIGRDITRHENGSGIISKQALRVRIRASGVVYTPRHYNRLLAQGNGLFWHLDGSQIYLRSVVKVSRDLVQQADEAGLLLEDNLPGVREVYLDVSGSLEQWEGTMYAGWIASRGYSKDLTIARETLAQLFNRHENTIRRWEEKRLQNVVTKRTNYAQCPDIDHYFPYLPEHAQAYVARVSWRGQVQEEVRLRWQLPNTYHAAISHHPHKGQAAKVRRAVRAVFPASEKRGGHLHPMYLQSSDKLKRLYRSLKFRMGLLGDVNQPVYVYRGVHHRTKAGMFEMTNTGFLFTHPNERLSPEQEEAVLARRLKRAG